MFVRTLSILAIFCSTAYGQWVGVAGNLKQVAAAGDGTVWGITSTGSVFRLVGSQWQPVSGQLSQISVGSAQHIWGVNAANAIYRWNGSGWVTVPGQLKEVSAAADGTVWGVNMAGSTYRYDTPSNNWIQQPAVLRSVAVGSAQEVWGLNPQGGVVRWTGAGWENKPGQLAGISVGADRSVWGVSASGAVYQWAPSQNNWEQRDGILAQISVANANTIWGVNAANAIFQRGAAATGTGTTTVTLGPVTTITGTLNTTPITILPVSPPTFAVTNYVQAQAGELVCAMNLGSETEKCGTRKAEYVGSYSLNMKCDSGFFDPIYGGTCWSCPGDVDGYGAFIRSATAVDSNDACWRVPKEHFNKAARIKGTPWAWECSSGTFWDPKGACYQCPAGTPRRTAYPVDHDRACASDVNETRTATLLKFNGCPSPDATKMKREGKLAGKSLPGKPFLDIAGGWSQGSISGGCYTCPTVDSDGNFLITQRNARPIYGDNKGCTIYENYRPATFLKPGLSGLTGLRSLLLEKNHLTANNILFYLHALAVASGKAPDSAEARAWVGQELADMANSPYRNKSFRGMVLGLMTAALETPEASRTPSQKALLASMAAFSTNWRIHVAQQSLNMYDAWKKWDETNKVAQSRLMTMFDYGTVPLDFQTIVTALSAPTAVGVGVAGALGAVHSFNAGLNWIKTTKNTYEATNSLFRVIGGGNAFANAAKVAQGISTLATVSAGASAIAIVGAVLTGVASSQFQAIVTARPNLEAALATARVPVTMDQIYTGGDGASKLQYLWVMAMDTEVEGDDPQVTQLVNAANQTAKAAGYAVPK